VVAADDRSRQSGLSDTEEPLGCRATIGSLPMSLSDLGRTSPAVEVGTVSSTLCQGRPRRPCHQRAIHTSPERSRADNHGQRHGGLDLAGSLPLQVAILADLAWEQVISWSRLASALPCPAGRSISGRGGPERRRRPRPDGTGPSSTRARTSRPVTDHLRPGSADRQVADLSTVVSVLRACYESRCGD
jgi:hypothetical protein